jgi:hypothetical protein
MQTFLEKLRVDWPTALERTSTETLRSRVLTELTPVHDGETLPPGVLGRLCLKELMQELGRGTGYDPNVDNCLGRTWSLAGPEKLRVLLHSLTNLSSCVSFAVTEDLLSVLAELQEAVRHWREGSYSGLVSGSLFCGPVANQVTCIFAVTVPFPYKADTPDAVADSCMVVHVVSCEEEFQQQKLDLLWWKVDDQAPLSQVG